MSSQLLQFLLFLLVTPVLSQPWDGVIITQADYQGLQAFRHSLDDPRGLLRSWNGTGIGACSGAWAGIKCARGKVIVIQLPWRGLGGHISEKIGQLPALRKLNLHDNNIGGQIPPAIGFLRDLRGVYLFNNRFSGTIPPSIGNCVVLQTLDLSNNWLTGSVPSSVSNSTRLYRLNLSFNNLSGSIPVGITQSPSLTFLFLHHNNLSGSIPDTWGGNQSDLRAYRLQALSFDHNSITGEIPSSLGKLELLKEVALSSNRLNGTIPEEFGTLSQLRTLDLSENSIGGSLATLGNLTGLSQLDLSENNLTGEIPSSFNRLTNLTSFNVSYNNLSGPVPYLLAEKFNSSSFAGNVQLCGYSASTLCPPPNFPPPSVPPKRHGRRLTLKDVILIAAGIGLLLLLLLCCVLLCCLVKKRASVGTKSSEAEAAGRGEKPGQAVGAEGEAGVGEAGGKLVHFDGPLAFTADDLLCATAEIMGKSTYGTVYKATLEDGSQVAVKRLREKFGKGQKEFETEVNLLGKIRHPNLLALRAYYLGPKGEKLLVFDFMPKGSLAAFLHARGPETAVDWPTRMNIAMGTARGLRHLHGANTVHGNLTSSNILLDDDNNPKIADFGLSRLMTAAANANAVAAAAALGYRAPELSKLKKASTKTDVYSLGVVMLELLTGKSPADVTNGMELPQWVASIVKEEWTNEVFDVELLRDEEAGDELLSTLKLALHCVDPSPAARPEVQEVLQQLEQIRLELAGTVVGSTSDEGAVVAGPSTTGEGGSAGAGGSAGGD